MRLRGIGIGLVSGIGRGIRKGQRKGTVANGWCANRIQTWALEEARRRLEDEGIVLTDESIKRG